MQTELLNAHTNNVIHLSCPIRLMFDELEGGDNTCMLYGLRTSDRACQTPEVPKTCQLLRKYVAWAIEKVTPEVPKNSAGSCEPYVTWNSENMLPEVLKMCDLRHRKGVTWTSANAPLEFPKMRPLGPRKSNARAALDLVSEFPNLWYPGPRTCFVWCTENVPNLVKGNAK